MQVKLSDDLRQDQFELMLLPLVTIDAHVKFDVRPVSRWQLRIGMRRPTVRYLPTFRRAPNTHSSTDLGQAM